MMYRVSAPYVTLKVKDPAGNVVVKGFYEGAPVPDSADTDNLQSLIDSEMVEEVEGSPESEAPEAPSDEAPKGNASREEWAAYAKTKGASDEEVASVEEGGLKQTELREKYGN